MEGSFATPGSRPRFADPFSGCHSTTLGQSVVRFSRAQSRILLPICFQPSSPIPRPCPKSEIVISSPEIDVNHISVRGTLHNQPLARIHLGFRLPGAGSRGIPALRRSEP